MLYDENKKITDAGTGINAQTDHGSAGYADNTDKSPESAGYADNADKSPESGGYADDTDKNRTCDNNKDGRKTNRRRRGLFGKNAVEAEDEKIFVNRNAFKGGSYSIIISVIVLAILIVVNILVGALPKSLTTYDISSSKLYSITSNTKVVVNGLTKDVTIYWIVQSGEEDDVVESLLSKYESLSDHIEVVKKNPDIYPTFASEYTDEQVANNSLVVVCGDRSRYVAYSDIYVQETDVYSYSYTTSFDGEGAITSAIDYVISDELTQIAVLSGHGEADLPSTLADNIDKDNMEVSTLTLATDKEVAEGTACVIIYDPQSDISEEEKSILTDYVSEGGNLLVFSGTVDDETDLTNLNSILEDYGVEVNEGIVIDGDEDHYAFSTPYALIPNMESSDITDSLISENYTPIIAIAKGLDVSEADSNVTAFLTTSEMAYVKAQGYGITTYEMEEDDIDGQFALGVSVSEGSGTITWFSSSEFVQDTYNAYASGANVDLAMNALVSVADSDSKSIAIRSKSLNYDYLTISDSQAGTLKFVLMVALPLVYLGIGIIIVVKRRKGQIERA